MFNYASYYIPTRRSETIGICKHMVYIFTIDPAHATRKNGSANARAANAKEGERCLPAALSLLQFCFISTGFTRYLQISSDLLVL